MEASCRGMPWRVCADRGSKNNFNKPFQVRIYRILSIFPPLEWEIIALYQTLLLDFNNLIKKSFGTRCTLTRIRKCDRKWMTVVKMSFLTALKERYLFPTWTKLACLTRFPSMWSCLVICVIIKGRPLGNKPSQQVLNLFRVKAPETQPALVKNSHAHSVKWDLAYWRCLSKSSSCSFLLWSWRDSPARSADDDYRWKPDVAEPDNERQRCKVRCGLMPSPASESGTLPPQQQTLIQNRYWSEGRSVNHILPFCVKYRHNTGGGDY